jgi:hypothetical protein
VFAPFITGTAELGFQLFFMTEGCQRINVPVGLQDNIAAFAAIAAIGPAFINVFFMTKTEFTVTAFASFDSYGDFVDKAHLVTDVVLECGG